MGKRMNIKLYVYDHCPYCVKARMIFGIKSIDFRLHTLLNDDVSSPVSMIGKKMLPILELESKKYMPESLDIIEYIDKQNPPKKINFTLPEDKDLMNILDEHKLALYSLVMPRWLNSTMAEFQTKGARSYFREKKEKMIGSFDRAMEETEKYKKVIEGGPFKKLERKCTFKPGEKLFWYHHGRLSLNDFHLFAFLRSLSIVKGLSWPEGLKSYALWVSKVSGVNLHFDIAS